MHICVIAYDVIYFPREGRTAMRRRKNKLYLELTDNDIRILFEGLMNWRNELLADDHPVEPINDMLVRIMDLI